MKRILSLLIFTLTFTLFALPLDAQSKAHALKENSERTLTVTFAPPPGWKSAESDQLPKRVKSMVVGTSSKGYPPSINLATESYSGSLKDYLKVIKSINDAKGAQWKNLGDISTQTGLGSLSQVDTKTQWGDLRMMHVILLKDQTIYILTATALKEEFPLLYKEFFKAFRSLKVSDEEPQPANA